MKTFSRFPRSHRILFATVISGLLVPCLGFGCFGLLASQEPGSGRVPFTIGYLIFDLLLIGSICLIWWSALRTYGTDCFGMCDRCGYDLRALTSGGPCPECGRALPPVRNS
ncbi:MAG: hypothetical protein CBC35_04040 [Planctomycetes bacterium TMED75]|nr:hypothetical protein [Planctomycetaceae bacterium]OUU94370.1 MAG: hypothetical protein CBC35_04040 [Planctomycetes bacterium TMED75]